MKTFKRNFSFLFTACFLIIFVNSISAQMIKIPIEEITLKSSKIIKGVVINKYSEFEDNSEYILTVININVRESIKGQVNQVESLVIPGGVVGNLGMEVSGAPKFELNDEVLVFIDYDFKGRQTVTEWNHGKFLVKNNRILVDDRAIIINDFIMNLRDFIQNGQVGKIEMNNNSNPPNSPMLLVPTINYITPNSGVALRPYAINPNNPFIPGEKGTVIDIYGSNFGSIQGSSVVRFYENVGAAADAQYILTWNDTHIQCKVPGRQWDGSHFLNASSGSVYVITSAGESNGQQFDISFATSNKRFSNNIITFYVNENGTPDVSDEFAVIQSSLQTWSSVLNSNHSFLYAGTTIRTPGSRNNYNDIGWLESNWPYQATTIAVTTTWFDASENSNIIYESDIAINGVNFTWSSSGQTDRMDIQNIVTHELGHTLNLQDLYGNTDIEKQCMGIVAMV